MAQRVALGAVCALVAAHPAALAAAPQPRRPVPELDGRVAPPPTAEEMLAWGPRVVFFPLWWVTERVVRQPIVHLLRLGEAGEWPEKAVDAFTTEDGEFGAVPTILYRFGFRPSVGAWLFWKDRLGPGSRVDLSIATGGSRWYLLSAHDRHTLWDGRGRLDLHLSWKRRPDHQFHGLGFTALHEDGYRYDQEAVRLKVELGRRWWRQSWVRGRTGLAAVRYAPDGCCGTSLQTAIAEGLVPAPPGLEEGFRAWRLGLTVLLDSRGPVYDPKSFEPPQGDTDTGVRLELDADGYVDLDRPGRLAWLRYGATLTGVVDLTGTRRLLGATLHATLADPLGAEPVPFTELARIGGGPPAAGLYDDPHYGRSVMAVALHYRWPVWTLADAWLEVAAANAFGPWFDDFAPGRLRGSFAFGVRAVSRYSELFYLLVGFGTEPLGAGGGVTSVRFLVGNTDAF